MSSALVNTNSYAVGTGPARLLLAQAPAGLLIVNNDSANGVWLSDQPSVSPGSGFFLGPLGSLTWATVGPVYGIVDTGVTSPVSLTIGGAASAVDNPVAIGAAIAAKLLLTGVPNVIAETVILNDVNLNVPPYNNEFQIDISRYSQLLIAVAGGPATLELTQEDASSNQAMAVTLTFDPGLRNDIALIRADAPILDIIVDIANPGATLTIIGSNRVQKRSISRMNYGNRGIHASIANTAMAVNGNYAFTLQNKSGYVDGPCVMSLFIASSAASLTIIGELQIITAAGSFTYNLMDTGQMSPSGTKGLYLSWLSTMPIDWSAIQFHCRAADTVALTLDIIPMEV